MGNLIIVVLVLRVSHLVGIYLVGACDTWAGWTVLWHGLSYVSVSVVHDNLHAWKCRPSRRLVGNQRRSRAGRRQGRISQLDGPGPRTDHCHSESTGQEATVRLWDRIRSAPSRRGLEEVETPGRILGSRHPVQWVEWDPPIAGSSQDYQAAQSDLASRPTESSMGAPRMRRAF